MISLLVLIFLLPCPGTTPGQTSVPKDTVITLERFPDAFDNGWRYNLTINANGSVSLVRFKHLMRNFDPNAPLSQTFETKISREQLAELVAAFERYNFFSLKDSYAELEDGCPALWTDQGAAETSITIGGKTKTIWHYYGCGQDAFGPAYPVELTALETTIDDVVGTKQWLKQ